MKHRPLAITVARAYAAAHPLPVWINWPDLVAAALERIAVELTRRAADAPRYLSSWARWGIIDYLHRATRLRNGRKPPWEHRDDLPGRVELACTPAEPPVEADHIARADARNLIAAVLGAMPAAARDLMIAYWLEHRSQADIARQLGLWPSQVCSRLGQARRLFCIIARRLAG